MASLADFLKHTLSWIFSTQSNDVVLAPDDHAVPLVGELTRAGSGRFLLLFQTNFPAWLTPRPLSCLFRAP